MSKFVTVLALFTALAVAQPQAYVPTLSPLVRTTAVLPEELRDQGTSGEVHLLVAIDAQGNVISSEPLEGSASLRPLAMDAVKTWKFQPVLRDGKAVVAYTDVAVRLVDRGRGLPYKSIPGEGRAGYERVRKLEEEMPRSAKQKLLDLEQDSNGVEPGNDLRRVLFLPRLAKAALEVDDPELAATYAKELLAADTRKQPWFGGVATHDGNMVLGMVAIQKGDVETAKEYLLKAGKTVGAPTLNSFGPNMLLAQKLLEKGEKETVLEYFKECRVFWNTSSASDKLDTWSQAIRDDKAPKFGANLRY